MVFLGQKPEAAGRFIWMIPTSLLLLRAGGGHLAAFRWIFVSEILKKKQLADNTTDEETTCDPLVMLLMEEIPNNHLGWC